MQRSSGEMSPRLTLWLLMVINFVVITRAGPLGPMPNVTSADYGLKEGSCAVGDVVYMSGDEFPGSTPCEKCSCADGSVQCAQQVCEPRPGCKALHRPDHCCPTYQCECEQEGRVYGNGEKLVDPADPCRVCYCQGGEVVCRRIACFVRDDCTPRLVPGRCCPEYDNCPLRGVTSLPTTSSPASSLQTKIENVEAASSPSKEKIKEFTIKEITPVSEIPVITEVKIKEILPSPSIEIAEYSSSKSPLIPREVTSEQSVKEADVKTESPTVVEIHLPSSSSSPLEVTKTTVPENKDGDENPSKISLSTQDSVHSSILPSNMPVAATMGVFSVTSEPLAVATTKAPLIEDDDTFDHNPAFPPLPDDLSVLRNHEDEIVPEPIVDNEHVQNHGIIVGHSTSTEEVKITELLTTSTVKDISTSTTATFSTTEKEISEPIVELTSPKSIVTTEAPSFKESPTINLRSAIPTEILNSPALIIEEMTRNDTTTGKEENIFTAISSTDISKIIEISTVKTTTADMSDNIKITPKESNTSSDVTTSALTDVESTAAKATQSDMDARTIEQELTTSEIAKSNIATEIMPQTELSSLPVETSDQNPHEVSEQTTSDEVPFSTIESSSIKVPTTSEVITVSKDETSGLENIETTEFILSSFGSSETVTDNIELIKISAEPEKSAAIINAESGRNNNALTDLINLVNDVASISGHKNEQGNGSQEHATTTAGISDSEELIPVNAGYKSKNKNFNQNSITEIPLKSKISGTVNKQKVVEIEDDESESVTDSLPPNDKVEPTTKRPIIDNVSDDNVTNNKTAKKDIEIITQSYVPTINRKPTKVVMKKKIDKSKEEETAAAPSVETITDNITSNETPLPTIAEASTSAETTATTYESSPVEANSEKELQTSPGPSAVSELNVTTERLDAAQ